MRIVVCDSGVGNVRSVVRAVERACGTRRGVTVSVSADPDVVRRADALVVPGQGHFGAFARAMEAGLGDALAERIRDGARYLGICLGMQVLFDTSDEAPGARGLSIWRGRTRRLSPGVDPDTGRVRPLPHVGWNEARGRLLDEGAQKGARHFYFAHTFVIEPEDESLVAATTEYGERFPSAIAKDAVVGVQFHPEKSQRAGLDLLARFFGA